MNLEVKIFLAWLVCSVTWFLTKTVSDGELKVKDFIGDRAGFAILGPLAWIISVVVVIYRVFHHHGEHIIWRSHGKKVESILYDKKDSGSKDSE